MGAGAAIIIITAVVAVPILQQGEQEEVIAVPDRLAVIRQTTGEGRENH
jgi:hypothetical protein